MTENYIKPEDVRPEVSQKILDFLNSAQSAEEIANAIEIPSERDVGIIVAQHILDRRKQLGKFTNLQQVADVQQVGPERFSEIISTLRERQPAETATTTSAEQEEVPDVAWPEMSEEKEIKEYKYAFFGPRHLLEGRPVHLYLYDASSTLVAIAIFEDDSAAHGESVRHEFNPMVNLYYSISAFPHLIDMLRNEKPVYLRWYAVAGAKKLVHFVIGTSQEAVGEEETQ